MSEQLPYIPGAPDPDVRKRMMVEAVKGTKFAKMFTEPTLTDEEKLQKRLELLTQTIFNTCVEVKRRDESARGVYDEVAMQKLVMTMWKDGLVGYGKDELHCLLCIVLTGVTLEGLQEVN